MRECKFGYSGSELRQMTNSLGTRNKESLKNARDYSTS